MPEGPEVKCVTNYLNNSLSGKHLVKVLCDDPLKYFQINHKRKECRYDQLIDHLPAVIERVFCKGKCIFFELRSLRSNNVMYMYSHLIMTGRWVINQTSTSDQPRFTLCLGEVYNLTVPLISILCKVYYEDSRGLGHLDLLTKDEMTAKLNSLGPDLLSEEVSWEQWLSITKRCPRRQLVSFLMEPSLVCGIGNYLKSEILYRCRLAPDRKVSSLTTDENCLLYKTAICTIRESYEYGGLTIKDYWHPDGKKGLFPIHVYCQKFDPDGNKVETSKFADGRTTHWVPTVQM